MEDSKRSHGLAGLLNATEIKKRWYEFLDANPIRGARIIFGANGHNEFSQESLTKYLGSIGWSREDYEMIFRVQTTQIDGEDSIETRLDHKHNELTIGSWNIQFGIRYEEILEMLQDGLGLDVIVLQEVARFHKWSDYENLLDVLVGKTGFTQVAYSPSFVFPNEKAKPLPELGNAILSRYPLLDSRVLRLMAVHDWTKDGRYPRLGQRIALYATVQINGKCVGLYDPHFEVRCSTPKRVRQLCQIFDDAGTIGYGRIIVAGDINEWRLNMQRHEQDEITQLAMERGYEDPFGKSLDRTLNSYWSSALVKSSKYFHMPKNTRLTNDRIFSKGFEVKGFEVMKNVNLTDHFPVKVVLGYK